VRNGFSLVSQPGACATMGNFADGDCCPSTCMFAMCKRPVESAASQLVISNRTPDKKDRVSWKWSKGAATSIDELADPTAGNGYTLCVSPAAPPSVSLRAPAGSDWRPTKKGFRYRSRSGVPDGLRSVTLAAGLDGKAKLSV
jgi:hypothetical protein